MAGAMSTVAVVLAFCCGLAIAAGGLEPSGQVGSHSDPAGTMGKQRQQSFTPSDYPMKWMPPASEVFPDRTIYDGRQRHPSEKNGHQSFTPNDYPVKWRPPASEVFLDRTIYDGRQRHPSNPAPPPSHAQARRLHMQKGMLFLKTRLQIGAALPEGTTFARPNVQRWSNVSTHLEYKELDSILSSWKIARGTKKARQVAETLISCGEAGSHACFSRRDEMVRWTAQKIQIRKVRVAKTMVHGREGHIPSRYIISGMTPLSKDIVACYAMPFPYHLYYCHRPKAVQAFTVGLVHGAVRVRAIAVCHLDTSTWDAAYFELVHGQRGDAICHYMPGNYVTMY